jgi:ribosome-binding factor A
METQRQQKVGRLLQKELGEMLQREGGQLSGGKMVTVTVVRVSSDLSVARVYLSFFPADADNAALEAIKVHARELRYELGKRIGKQLRLNPELAFFGDDSADYSANIDRLLNS